jgi:hypothetical protein
MEFGRSNGLLIQDWVHRRGGLRGMVVEISKHSKNSQSRTVVRYVEMPAEPWYLGLEVPDAATALFLTWHKAGMKMPEELVESSRRKLEEKRAHLNDRRNQNRNEYERRY